MKTKNNLKIYNLKIPIFEQNINIIFYKKGKSINKYFNDYELSKFSAFVYTQKDGKINICFHEKCITPGIIAHEAKHAVNDIFIDIHAKLDLHNDEPEAYLLGWLVQKIHDFWDKQKIKNNHIKIDK